MKFRENWIWYVYKILQIGILNFITTWSLISQGFSSFKICFDPTILILKLKILGNAVYFS